MEQINVLLTERELKVIRTGLSLIADDLDSKLSSMERAGVPEESSIYKGRQERYEFVSDLIEKIAEYKMALREDNA